MIKRYKLENNQLVQTEAETVSRESVRQVRLDDSEGSPEGEAAQEVAKTAGLAEKTLSLLQDGPASQMYRQQEVSMQVQRLARAGAVNPRQLNREVIVTEQPSSCFDETLYDAYSPQA